MMLNATFNNILLYRGGQFSLLISSIKMSRRDRDRTTTYVIRAYHH
jgi:hypothetical protein